MGENSEQNQLELRLKDIEDKFKEIDLNNTIYENSHKKFLRYITIIFGIVAFFFTAAAVTMGFFSYKSSSDINDAISNMQNTTNELTKQVYGQLTTLQKDVTNFNSETRDKFYSNTDKMDSRLDDLTNKINAIAKTAIDEMRAEITEFKSEAKKKPKIDIIYKDKIVTNTSITIKSTRSNHGEFTYILKDLGIQNNGDGLAYVTSIKFSSPQKIVAVVGGGWFEYDTSVLPFVI